MSELRSAAVSILNENQHHGVDPRAVILAHGYLTEHPADDNELVTIDWLNSLKRADGGDFGMFAVRFVRPNFHLMAVNKKPTTGIDGINDWVSPRPATRGDVRRLCAALGVELIS